METRVERHTISLKNALTGIIWAFKTQPNYQIHFFLSFLSILVSFMLNIEKGDFLVIITLIVVGLVIETINTSIEKATDAISHNYNEDIRIAKDVAAGAMLIFSFGATILAIIIFSQYIF